jgi:hypothetical protein
MLWVGGWTFVRVRVCVRVWVGVCAEFFEC